MRKPNRIVSMLLAIALVAALVIPAYAASTPTFSDVPANHWAYSYIEEMAAKGVVNGIGGGKYGPSNPVSTAEFATMITRAFWPGALNSDTVLDRFYENPDAWWVPYISAIDTKAGLNGTKAYTTYVLNNGGPEVAYVSQWGSFVTDPVSRYDMAQMIYNLMSKKGVAMPSDSAQTAAQKNINDWSQVPASYQTAVKVCYALGILNGKDGGKFGGNDTMTRAEAATVMSRLFKAGITTDDPNAGTGTVTPTPTPTPTPEPSPSDNGTSSGTTAKTGYLTNGKPITEENVLEILAQLKKEYPTGTPWAEGPETLRNDSGFMKVVFHDTQYANSYGSRGCGGFAILVTQRIFGTTASGNPLRQVTDFTKIRPGDIIVYKSANGEVNHIATAITSSENRFTHLNLPDGFLTAEDLANADYGVYTVDGNEGDQVIWNEPEDGSTPTSLQINTNVGEYIEVWTRYPN